MEDVHNFFKEKYDRKIGCVIKKFLKTKINIMEDAVRDNIPPVQLLSEDLKTEFGEYIQQDDMKQLVGYLVRKVLEETGNYEHLQYDVKIQEENMFVYGSTYKKVSNK